MWSKTFGGTSADYGYKIVSASDGGYVFAAQTTSTNGDISANHGLKDFWIVKLDGDGTIQWEKTFGGSNTENLFYIIATSDGGFAVTGNTFSTDGDVTGLHGTNGDAWVIKIDSLGNLQWQKTYGGTDIEAFYEIKQTSDGGYICVGLAGSVDGDVTGFQGGLRDFWIVKITENGTLEWQKTFGGTSADNARSVVQKSEGTYIVAGTTDSDNGDIEDFYGNDDICVINLSPDGTLLWKKNFGGSLNDTCLSLISLANDNYMVCGDTASSDNGINNHGGRDALLVEFTPDGQLVWQKAYGGTANDRAINAVQTQSGKIQFCGETASTNGDISANHGGNDAWLVEIDAAGAILWEHCYGGTLNDTFTAVTEIDGHLLAAGASASNNGDVSINQGMNDAWIVNFDENLGIGNVNATSFVVYPNPVQSIINIVSDELLEKVTVCDQTGRTVLEKNNNCTTLDLSNLSTGMYTLSVSLKGKVYSTKIIKSN
jgi:hypothetical protein